MTEKYKLAISNVAWYPKRTEEFIKLVSSLGCEGVELATSMIWDEPIDSSLRQRNELRNMIESEGLKVVGLQALLFTRRDLTLFGDVDSRKDVVEYLTGMMDICRDLGGNTLVFGSPRNRNMGGLDKSRAWDSAVDFFRVLGERAGERGVYFCIEPLGAVETDFINSVSEARKLMDDIGDNPGIGLHIDTKGLIDADEVEAGHLVESFGMAKHVHLSDQGLKPTGSSGFNHSVIYHKIKQSRYSRYASIEMRRTEPEAETSIRRAVEYVKKIYFPEKND